MAVTKPAIQPAAGAGSAINQHAANLLASLGVKADRIVRVYPDAILYVFDGKARTAFLTSGPDKKMTAHVKPGFPAWKEDE